MKLIWIEFISCFIFVEESDAFYDVLYSSLGSQKKKEGIVYNEPCGEESWQWLIHSLHLIYWGRSCNQAKWSSYGYWWSLLSSSSSSLFLLSSRLHLTSWLTIISMLVVSYGVGIVWSGSSSSWGSLQKSRFNFLLCQEVADHDDSLYVWSKMEG